MYHTIVVDDWKSVDVYEVIQALPADGKSTIVVAEQSADAVEISEFASGRVH